MRKPCLLVPTLCLATGLAVLIGCSSDRAGTLPGKKASSTLVVTGAVPEWTSVDVDPPGPSVGVREEFTAALSIDGKPAGELVGLLTVQTPGKSNGGSVVKEERTGTLTFQLSAADSLIVNGTAKYQPKKKEMEVGDPQLRSVTGGTGAYEGAKGTASTVRNADGTYTHTFELKLVS